MAAALDLIVNAQDLLKISSIDRMDFWTAKKSSFSKADRRPWVNWWVFVNQIACLILMIQKQPFNFVM